MRGGSAEEYGSKRVKKLGVTLVEALLDPDPVVVALIRLADGAAVEGTMAAQPHDEARRLAPLAKGRELQFKVNIGHHHSSLVRPFSRLVSHLCRLATVPSAGDRVRPST